MCLAAQLKCFQHINPAQEGRRNSGKSYDGVPSQVLRGDHVTAEVSWGEDLRGKAVRIEATLEKMAMFSFQFASERATRLGFFFGRAG